MNQRLLAPLALLALLLTGCPHNEYTVDLKPHGNSIERTITFYTEDGKDTNSGTPNYQSFPTVELSNIDSLYPSNGLSDNGKWHKARGEFTNSLPEDIGGAGSYTNLDTSLGSAGFYVERFRGNDDLDGMTERSYRAADQLADLMLGWSKAELGAQPGYDQLRQFLDVDFRRDLKNATAYWWEGNLVERYQTNGGEEFAVRFGQYLVERGYFKLTDAPAIFRGVASDDFRPVGALLQRLVAEKMGVADSQPLPASLAFLADEHTMDASFGSYITNTDLYHAKLKQWDEDRKQDPTLQKPDADTVLSNAAQGLLNPLGGSDDHLAVRLYLPVAPLHSNGRWDESLKAVVWDTDIPGRTNTTSLPVFCYANWAEPSESFQTEHFGKIALTGDNLTQYCVWRSSLSQKQAVEWETMLTGLHPGDQLTNQLAAFRFSDEPQQTGTNTPTGPSAFARDLIKSGL
jgi:hypothetical protein